MCKFSLPVVPETATQDEKRAIMFEALSSLDLNEMCEKRAYSSFCRLFLSGR